MLSVDHGDDLRRRYGIDAVNRLMGLVGREFQRGLRKYDHSGHYGDGAILVILPGATLEVSEQVAQRFAAALSRTVQQGPELSGTATFSVGAAEFGDGDSRDRWLGRAQASLIRARSLGGDRIETDGRLPNAYRLWKAERLT
jgi:diguanylate cyclase